MKIYDILTKSSKFSSGNRKIYVPCLKFDLIKHIEHTDEEINLNIALQNFGKIVDIF